MFLLMNSLNNHNQSQICWLDMACSTSNDFPLSRLPGVPNNNPTKGDCETVLISGADILERIILLDKIVLLETFSRKYDQPDFFLLNAKTPLVKSFK